MALSAGDWVEIRSKSEILQTLDSDGRLADMPFMPEMFQYCGQRLMVQSRAHKTCDPIYTIAARRLTDTVHLNLRCDGKGHGGCQAGCLLFWNEAWLKPVSSPIDGANQTEAIATTEARPAGTASVTEEQVRRAARVDGGAGEPTAETRYVCQTTQLNEFTKPLPWWDPRQYLEDYMSGNVTFSQLLQGGFYVAFGRRFARRLPFMRLFYNTVQAWTGGMPSPARNGTLPDGQAWPNSPLNLQPGELVRVKGHDEILATVRSDNQHRGLGFDVELVPFCGGVYRVRDRVERFIDEKTGKMRSLKSTAVILENVWCTSRFSKCRMFCPRKIYSWWREEWLERAGSRRSTSKAE